MKTKSITFRVLIGLVCFVILFVILIGVAFVFTYVHQVQTQQKFRVTITKFGAPFVPHAPTDDSWRVVVEQLSYERLKNVEIQSYHDNSSSGHPLYGNFLHNSTLDGRAQTDWGQYPQPLNITIVWDGGRESFVFNRYPFVQQFYYAPRPSEKVMITQVSFDKTTLTPF